MNRGHYHALPIHESCSFMDQHTAGFSSLLPFRGVKQFTAKIGGFKSLMSVIHDVNKGLQGVVSIANHINRQHHHADRAMYLRIA